MTSSQCFHLHGQCFHLYDGSVCFGRQIVNGKRDKTKFLLIEELDAARQRLVNEVTKYPRGKSLVDDKHFSCGNYISNRFLKVSCNGGLNQMRVAVCVSSFPLSLILRTFLMWGHFIESLRDEVQIVKRLPKRFSRKYGFQPLEMPPISWSSEKYYLEQVDNQDAHW
ncbi:unnamed protein product [Lactuca saligna]|uniref:Uncharacterized protein n=1 Tax=Lactuca saligna TaxID=75948 RepID=A0AA35UV53_LACSI|nr:unnamed protein product [Lactuca saligna]